MLHRLLHQLYCKYGHHKRFSNFNTYGILLLRLKLINDWYVNNNDDDKNEYFLRNEWSLICRKQDLNLRRAGFSTSQSYDYFC